MGYDDYVEKLVQFEKELKSESDLKNEYVDEVQFEDLFSSGKSHTIIDGSFGGENYGSNGKKLLASLKEKTTVISEKTECAKNDYNLTSSIHNVYKYNGLILTVTSSEPRSLKHTKYEFVCSSK